MDANAVNVFIDGTSYKNDVLTGGVSGQDTSRGNPFPQNAVQEFRVVTQNFKAEDEKSASAIITAVTKSGGNDLHGDGFAQYQDKSLVADDDCANTVNGRCGTAHNTGHEKPTTALAAGVSVGGLIVKDQFHFFGSTTIRTGPNNAGGGLSDAPGPGPLKSSLPFQETSTAVHVNLAFGKVSGRRRCPTSSTPAGSTARA